jgi:starch phosphorylase
MEIGLEPSMPTYSGGLGVLAGDTLRAAADIGLPMVAVTLLYRKGYFRQHLDRKGSQTESAATWRPQDFLEPLSESVTLLLDGKQVQIRAWRYIIKGATGHTVPVYLLDTALPENDAWHQTLTDHLYGGDERYRLCQEAVLGLGGVAMLRALGHEVSIYHLNEGHSALLTIALLEQQAGNRGLRGATWADVEGARKRCVFTTHTPVAAGHDKFPLQLVRQILGEDISSALSEAGCCVNGTLNMTALALAFSHYVNGVSMRHEQVSQDMFPEYPINSISNGVHAATWACEPFSKLFDRRIPEWRRDNMYLRYAISIARDEIQEAHAQAKRDLAAEVERRTGLRLNPAALTIGYARRATPYKRPNLIFSDLERLRQIARQAGPIQIIYAGKAHPRDEGGKEAIRYIFGAAETLKDDVTIVYLEEYGMGLAKLLCSGVDLWLNTPQKPLEASGTSGMKAAINGVPSFSVLDGWWLEGHVEGVTGWSIGDDPRRESKPAEEIASMYNKLEFTILPMFYSRPRDFARVQRWAIALNGSFFNAQRTVLQYLGNAYLPGQQRNNRPV